MSHAGRGGRAGCDDSEGLGAGGLSPKSDVGKWYDGLGWQEWTLVTGRDHRPSECGVEGVGCEDLFVSFRVFLQVVGVCLGGTLLQLDTGAERVSLKSTLIRRVNCFRLDIHRCSQSINLRPQNLEDAAVPFVAHFPEVVA